MEMREREDNLNFTTFIRTIMVVLVHLLAN